VRQAKHGPVTKLKCGCAHDDLYWLEQCPTDAAESKAVHDAWALDHAAAREGGTRALTNADLY
jgi:hypothetical protein